MKRRQFVLLLGAGGAAASSVGSGAFSSVEAERGVEVNVVEDENAYLGIEQVEHQISGEGTVAEITNQFAAQLHLTIEVVDGDSHIENIKISGENITDSHSVDFDIGHSKEVSVECNGSGEPEFTLKLKGEVGEGAGTVKTKETLSIQCKTAIQAENNGRGPRDDTGAEEGGRGPREDPGNNSSKSPGGGPPKNPKSDDDETSPSSKGGSDSEGEDVEENDENTKSD